MILSSPRIFCALFALYSFDASMKNISFFCSFAPHFSRERSMMRTATGIPVVWKSPAGRPMTASMIFSLMSCSLIFPSAPLRKRTPCGTMTAIRPVFGFAVSIMCVINAKSHLSFGGTPRKNRLYLSLEACSAHHFLRENGGFETRTSNFMS